MRPVGLRIAPSRSRQLISRYSYVRNGWKADVRSSPRELLYSSDMRWSRILAVAAALGPVAPGATPRLLDVSATRTNPIIDAAFGSTRNDCEGPRKPRIERLDINSDGSLDAIVWDQAKCYRSVGGYFALVTRRNGAWVNIGYGSGKPRWQRTGNYGWPNFEARELHYGKACFRFYEFTRGGERYWPNYLRENDRRHCRNQRHDHRHTPTKARD